MTQITPLIAKIRRCVNTKNKFMSSVESVRGLLEVLYSMSTDTNI